MAVSAVAKLGLVEEGEQIFPENLLAEKLLSADEQRQRVPRPRADGDRNRPR